MTTWMKIAGVLGGSALVASSIVSEPSGAPIAPSIVPKVQEQSKNPSETAGMPIVEEEEIVPISTPSPTPAPTKTIPKKDQEVVVPKLKSKAETNCHSSYSGCLKQNAGDYDCSGGTGNGPNYTGPVQVYESDPFDLDRDNDGWGCE